MCAERDGTDADNAESISHYEEDECDEFTRIRNLAANQTANAAIWRTLIVFVLQVSATIITVSTYLVVDLENIRMFRMAVYSASHNAERSANAAIDSVFLSLTDTSMLLSSYAEASGSFFPDTTFPNLDQHVTRSQERLQGVEAFFVFPTMDDLTSEQGPIEQSEFETQNFTQGVYVAALESGLPALGQIQGEEKGVSLTIAPIEKSDGVVAAYLSWPKILSSNLQASEGFDVIIENTCHQRATFQTENNDKHVSQSSFELDLFETNFSLEDSKSAAACGYRFSLYPTEAFGQSYETEIPFRLAMLVAATSIVMAVGFYAYDLFLDQMASIIIGEAAKSNGILASLFPSTVRDRLFLPEEDPKDEVFTESQRQLTSFVESENKSFFHGKPIADLFPEATIFFADLVGFTSWSSARDPIQVFVLLETVFGAFDKLAKKHNVFKVETVGDCYVAVVGVPQQRKDHAVVMANFARDCLANIRKVTGKLAFRLGPDTTKLTVRIGLHSGPVTAGVLRGEKSRFQLFGDTMNTASRMESTGVMDHIQISSDTAQYLIEAGKEHWFMERQDQVVAKGKGQMKTYFLTMSETNRALTFLSKAATPVAILKPSASNGDQSLIEWNAEMLGEMLKQVIASRAQAADSESVGTTDIEQSKELPNGAGNQLVVEGGISTGLGETNVSPLCDAIQTQLRAFITQIASRYRSNPFHSFEHASHVVMSVLKLLSRATLLSGNNTSAKSSGSSCFSSDSLTKFACAFSALIHDVDHRGVPNSQLANEEPDLVQRYDGKSPAERHSIEVGWDALIEGPYEDLRAAIFSNETEQEQFRRLVVNSVVATDIMDKELIASRNERWAKAFSSTNDSSPDNINLKVTIVVEHLIQASDVSHTMQHWHLFRRWNKALFFEMKLAHQQGRGTKDPAGFWYSGELGFFDHYIIPLAQKLKTCGFFGVFGDECLSYAKANRSEWEQRGRQCVTEMNAEFEKEFRKSQNTATSMAA